MNALVVFLKTLRERAGGAPNDAWDRAAPAWLSAGMQPLGNGGPQGAFAPGNAAAAPDNLIAPPSPMFAGGFPGTSSDTSAGVGRGILPFADRWIDPAARSAPAWLPSALPFISFVRRIWRSARRVRQSIRADIFIGRRGMRHEVGVVA